MAPIEEGKAVEYCYISQDLEEGSKWPLRLEARATPGYSWRGRQVHQGTAHFY